MASSLLIMVSIWFAFNVLFAAWRLWMTRPESWQIGTGPRQLSPVSVKWHPRRHI